MVLSIKVLHTKLGIGVRLRLFGFFVKNYPPFFPKSIWLQSFFDCLIDEFEQKIQREKKKCVPTLRQKIDNHQSSILYEIIEWAAWFTDPLPSLTLWCATFIFSHTHTFEEDVTGTL
jgi:hypothetical protein